MCLCTCFQQSTGGRRRLNPAVLSSSVGRVAGGKLDSSQVSAHTVSWPELYLLEEAQKGLKIKGTQCYLLACTSKKTSGNPTEACSPGPKREELGAEDLSGT